MGNTTNTRTLTNLIDEIPYELFIHIMEYYDIRIIYLIGNIGKINPIILSYMKNKYNDNYDYIPNHIYRSIDNRRYELAGIFTRVYIMIFRRFFKKESYKRLQPRHCKNIDISRLDCSIRRYTGDL